MRIRVETRQASDTSTREIDAAAVAVGSSPHNTIVLPGNQVGALHLVVNRTSDGRWRAEAQGPFRFGLGGRSGQKEALLHPGMALEIGPHVLRVAVPPEGVALALEVVLDAAPSGGLGARDLAGAGLGMRRPAWAIAGLLLILTLLIPLAMSMLPAERAVRQFLPTDTIWNSGRISNAHQHLANDCRSCHVDFFVQVRDDTCVSCHADMGDHSADPVILQASGLVDRSCANCHKEHGGTHAVLPHHPGLCTDCHAKPDRHPWSAWLPPAADFGRAHPDFRVQVIADWLGDRPQYARLPLTSSLRDEHGLIFPHDLHLAADLAGPDGPEMLACADCHRPGAGNVGFQPIAFEPHCQRCHALTIDEPDVQLTLPHADLPAARWMLERVSTQVLASASSSADEIDDGRRRAGGAADRGEGLTPETWVQTQIEARLCAKCHVVPAPGLGIAPVALAQSWWPHARFTHAPHQTTECAVCHAASDASDATEVLLPQIATCRSCHAGVGSPQGIQNTCVDCHSFHQVSETHGGTNAGAFADAATQRRDMGTEP